MCYLLDAEIFRDIIEEYPTFRQFLLVRSVTRRSYFNKAFSDTKQISLLQQKYHSHAKVVAAMGSTANDFIIDSDEEEENARILAEEKDRMSLSVFARRKRTNLTR